MNLVYPLTTGISGVRQALTLRLSINLEGKLDETEQTKTKKHLWLLDYDLIHWITE